MKLSAKLLAPIGAILVSSQLVAQTASRVDIVPMLGPSGTANNASSYPWNRTSNSMRIQWFYRGIEFYGYPVTIKKIRFRPRDSLATTDTWNGGTYGGTTIRMSTSPVTYDKITTTFASNHGTDLATVFNGAVTVQAGAGNGPTMPSKNYIDITLSTPFKYDPSKGPLVLDLAVDGSKWTGSTTGSPFTVPAATDRNTTDSRGFRRVFSTASHTATSGTLSRTYCMVMEMEYDFDATHVAFTQDRTAGVAGTKITFEDESHTSGTGGILGWSWDLDGDGKIGDATVKKPTWTYTKPGVYDITLRVTVAQGSGTKSLTKKGLVVIADPVADRTVPDLIQYQFNELRGRNVWNSASGTTVPREGVFINTGWHGDPARNLFNPNEKGFGCIAESGFANDNYVDTKWPTNIKGSMTVMWWQRLGATTVADPLAYIAGGAGNSFRIWTRGPAPGVLGMDGSATLGRFEVSRAGSAVTNTWAHCALVVDDTAGAAHWYVNGEKLGSKSYTPGTFALTNTSLLIGKHQNTNTMGRYYQVDDFRLYGSALTQRQVIASSQSENAAVNTYGVSCDGPGGTPTISTAGGAPTPGNFGFRVNLANAESGKACVLALGFQAHVGGALPLDISRFLSAGCQLETFPDLFFLGAVSATGTFSQPIPIPPDAVGLPGFHAYAQYAFQGSTKGGATRAIDINIQSK